jgi:hypothetical protein
MPAGLGVAAGRRPGEAQKTKMAEEAGKSRWGRWLMGFLAVLVAMIALGAGLLFKCCGCGGAAGELDLGRRRGATSGLAGSGPATATGPSATTATRRADLLAGKWDGRWASSTKNLGGALSAAITKTDETHYKATFTAESPLGTSTYEVVFTVKRQDGRWDFKGKKNLGLLSGGTYTYDGHTDGEDFESTYDSTFDRGVFKLRSTGD